MTGSERGCCRESERSRESQPAVLVSFLESACSYECSPFQSSVLLPKIPFQSTSSGEEERGLWCLPVLSVEPAWGEGCGERPGEEGLPAHRGLPRCGESQEGSRPGGVATGLCLYK